MATGSTQGHVALWDLEERKLQSQMRDAHSGAVTGMKCLPSEPLMVTSSADNSLKVKSFCLSLSPTMTGGGARKKMTRTDRHPFPIGEKAKKNCLVFFFAKPVFSC